MPLNTNLLPPTELDFKVNDNKVYIYTRALNTDSGRTGIALYRKSSAWLAADGPSAGTQIGYVAGTSNTELDLIQILSFGTYFYAAFSINNSLNTWSNKLSTTSVNITGQDGFNFINLNVPTGTHYYSVLNQNTSGDIIRLDASPVTVGSIAQAPVLASSLSAVYISGGDVLVTLVNPTDANRTTTQIWRKDTPWVNNSTAGATLVASISGTQSINQSFTDLNLSSGTHYYAVLNIGDGGTVRLNAAPLTIVAEPAVSTLDANFAGAIGSSLSTVWSQTNTTLANGAGVVRLGDGTARVRIGKASAASEGKINLEYTTQFFLDYEGVEHNSRVIMFEHSHPTSPVEINTYIAAEANATDAELLNNWVCITYSTLSNSNGVTTVRVKNNGTVNTVGSINHASGSVVSNVQNFLMFVGPTIKAAVKNALGTSSVIPLTPSTHPFSTIDLRRMSFYTRFRSLSNSNTDIILHNLMMFENQGEPVSNVRVIPLKSDNTRWEVGDDTEDYVKTEFNVDIIPNDESKPYEYLIEVDDVELSPRPTSFPVVYDSTLSFDVSHKIEVYSINRSPFPSTITIAPDDNAPVLTVDGPVSGSNIGSSQTFTATTSATSGIREVRWYIDNRLRKTDLTFPYNFVLTPSDYVQGNHTFRVVSVGNNDKTIELVRNYSFGVASPDTDVTAPTASINAPSEGANITSNVLVRVEAEDPAGIQKVEFLMDDSIKATAFTPTYNFIINPFAYTNGDHDFSVKVYDIHGNVQTIERSISITQPETTSTVSTILGDVVNIEPGLRTRTDVIWYGSFNADPWWETWYLDESDDEPTNQSNLSVITKNSLDGKGLRVSYPGQTTTCEHSPRFRGGGGNSAGGTKAKMDISTMGIVDQDELFIRYYVRFDPGFTWIGGGFLPGLAGGNLPVDCEDFDDDGWSGLHRWGQNGEIGVNVFANRIGDRQMNKCGMQYNFNVDNNQRLLRPGYWHCIEAQYRMNTAGENNGLYRAWFDNELALVIDNIRYRDTGKTYKIDTMLMYTYFAGTACNWWPKTSQFIQFDSFALGKSRIGVR